MDRGAERFIKKAVTDPSTKRPFPSSRALFVGVGDAKVARGGSKGEIYVPVGKMGEAMDRGYERERQRSNRQVLVIKVRRSWLVPHH